MAEDRADRYVWSDDNIVFGEPKKVAKVKPEVEEEPTFRQEVLPETIHGKAFKELQSWQKFVAGGKKRKYQTYMIRDEIATIVNDAIESQDAVAIKAAFEEAGELIAVKILRDVQSSFEKELKRLITGGRSGKIRRATFTNTLKTAIRQFGADAIRVGLTDGGVITNKDENLETEDEVVFDGILAEQLRLVKNLSEQVYKKGISDAQAKLKPRQWWGRSMLQFYDAGLLSADRNGMVEIVGVIDKNSCNSCRVLIGQRHRRRAFKEAGLMPPYGSNIICSDGGLCRHRPISVNARARGSLARVPRG